MKQWRLCCGSVQEWADGGGYGFNTAATADPMTITAAKAIAPLPRGFSSAVDCQVHWRLKYVLKNPSDLLCWSVTVVKREVFVGHTYRCVLFTVFLSEVRTQRWPLTFAFSNKFNGSCRMISLQAWQVLLNRIVDEKRQYYKNPLENWMIKVPLTERSPFRRSCCSLAWPLTQTDLQQKQWLSGIFFQFLLKTHCQFSLPQRRNLSSSLKKNLSPVEL